MKNKKTIPEEKITEEFADLILHSVFHIDDSERKFSNSDDFAHQFNKCSFYSDDDIVYSSTTSQLALR